VAPRRRWAYGEKLVTYTLVPLLVFALLALPGLIALLYKRVAPAFGKKPQYQSVQNAVAYWALFWFYTIYPAISVAVVAPWNCHWVNPKPQPLNPKPWTPNPNL